MTNVCRRCNTCAQVNPKRNEGCQYVTTMEPLEIIGVDVIGPIKDQYILTMIDYFSRFAFACVLKSRKKEEIVEKLKEGIKELGRPQKMLTDNAKEFESTMVIEFLKNENIKQHFTTPYHHESNGRVERLNRTLSEIIKKKKGSLIERVKYGLNAYNNNIHSAIKTTPAKAFSNNDPIIRAELQRLNSQESEYAARFGLNKNILKIEIGCKVWVKNENRKKKMDYLFIGPGKVIEILENNTYEIDFKGKTIKRHISQLKVYGEEEDVDRGMLIGDMIDS